MEWIAERRLIFAKKESAERGELTVRIGRPCLVNQQNVSFRIDEGMAVCKVEIEGLKTEHLQEVYGADLLQALQLAVDIEPMLIRLSKEYELFFPTGEPYFEEE